MGWIQRVYPIFLWFSWLCSPACSRHPPGVRSNMAVSVPAIPSTSSCTRRGRGGHGWKRSHKGNEASFPDMPASLSTFFIVFNLVTCNSKGKGTGLLLRTWGWGARELNKIRILLSWRKGEWGWLGHWLWLPLEQSLDWNSGFWVSASILCSSLRHKISKLKETLHKLCNVWARDWAWQRISFNGYKLRGQVSLRHHINWILGKLLC